MIRSVSLVLSGGGARGFFHLGVLAALRDLNIRIDEIAGTSAGAMAAILFAADPMRDLTQYCHDFPLKDLLEFPKSKTALVGSGKITAYFKKEVGVLHFHELKIPCRITATDINTGKEVVFHKGPIFPGLVASMSVPGLLAPVQYKDHMLLDGGIVNHLPLRHVRHTRGLVVSDLDFPLWKITKNASKKKVLDNAVSIQRSLASGISSDMIKKQKRVVYIRSTSDIHFLDFRKANRVALYKQGYSAIMRQKSRVYQIARKQYWGDPSSVYR